MADRGEAARKKVDVVFLDRDGTINVKPAGGEYVTDPSLFSFLPGAVEAIARLNRAGLRTMLVTNQRGIALGRMTISDLDAVHDLMHRGLERGGAHLDAIYYCPHENGACDCRKPEIGMFVRARKEWPGIDFASSAVIGDSDRDMEASRRIGALGVYVTTRTGEAAGSSRGSEKVVPSLRSAVDWLLPEE